MPDILRSANPTHSVCTHGHPACTLSIAHKMDNTPVGPHPPFMLLLVHAGRLLFPGNTLFTFMHRIEKIVLLPYFWPILAEISGKRYRSLYPGLDNFEGVRNSNT